MELCLQMMILKKGKINRNSKYFKKTVIADDVLIDPIQQFYQFISAGIYNWSWIGSY